MAANVKALILEYSRRLTQRANVDTLNQELAEYMRPTRSNITLTKAKGQRQGTLVFDGTPIQASSDFASALAGSFSSDEFRWFALRMRLGALNRDHAVMAWLEEVAELMFLAFQQSNFASEIHELYLDIAVFGTGCLFVEEMRDPRNGFRGFLFRTIAPGEYLIAEGPDGRVQKVMRKFKMSLEKVAGEFGVESLSEKSRERFRDRPEEEIDILHVVEPSARNVGIQIFPRRWRSIHIEHEAEHLLREKGYFTMPYLVPRWTKTSNEEYGRGQGHVALPHVRTLNRAVELRFKQWAKSIDPPMMELDDGVIGKVRLLPGSRNVVRQMDALKPIDSGARFDVGTVQEEQIRREIQSIFFSDRLQLPNKNFMTAFEIQQQIEVMQRFLGPQIGRLKSELFSPMIDRGFDLMMRQGALPPPPPIVLEAAAAGLGEIDIEYESPLSRQQRQSDLVALDRALQSAAPFVQTDPTLMDNFDGDEAVRHTFVVSGVPARLLRSIDARDQIRQARTQAQEQQAQQETDLAQSQVQKNQAEAVSKVVQAGGQGAA